MLAKRITRSRGKRRAYLSLGLLGGMLVLVALALGHFSATRAQAVGQCAPTTTANVVNCVFSTTTAIAPGGTLEIQVTNPGGAIFQAVVGSLPPGCAAISGSGTAIFTIGCAVASLGMPSGQTFTEAVANVPTGTAFVTYTVTYNANGSAPQVAPPTTGALACAVTIAPAFTCTNTGSLPGTTSGGTLTLSVAVPALSTETLQLTGVSGAGLGTCFVSAPLPPQPPAPGGSGTLTVTCASGQSTPNPIAAGSVTVSGTISSPGAVSTSGSCSGISPTATCTNTPGQTTPAGGTLALTLTDPGNNITAATAPAIATCAAPTYSGLGSSLVIIAYNCFASTPASAITVTGITTAGAGVTTNGTCSGTTPNISCTNVPGLVTGPVGTLTLTLTDPTNTIATAVAPAVGTCAAPVTAGLGTNTVTVTYSCATGTAPASAVSVTGITDAGGTATLTEATNSTGSVTETTASTGGAAFGNTSIVSNANGPLNAPGSIVPVPEVLTIGTCTAIAGAVNAPGTCTNTPTSTTQAGQQLVLSITAAVGQTIFAASVTAPVGNTCSLLTALPTSVTGPEGTLTVVFACDVGQTAPAGAYAVTLTNVNGVAGTPNEVTSINTQGPPTPGIPAPTTSNLTFQVCGVAVTCSLTATPTAATGTPGTSTPIPSTATPTSTTPPLGAGGSCGAPAGTATPTAGCVTTGTTCVPAARATTPAAPASGAPAVSPGGPYQGSTGNPLQFLGAALPAGLVPSDPNQNAITIISCVWQFGDGGFSHYIGATHTYLIAGPYKACLSVTDSRGGITTACAPVVIAPVGPLCQQPGAPLGSGLTPACSAAPGCFAASFNNGCQPTCPATGETLLPNQCPGPATNNQIWVNGPFNVGIDQPLTVTVDTNVGAGSSLLPGDVVKFDWGDGSVIYSTPQPGIVPAILFGGVGGTSAVSSSTTVPLTVCADQTIVGIVGPNACLNDGGPAPIQFQQAPTPGFNAAFPAPMTSAHGYTQPGTFNLRVTMIFSDGTGATAQTTVTVTGSPASLATAGSYPPPQSAATVAMPLNPGCNSISLTFPDGTAVTTVAAAVSGTTVVSIGETPANAPPLTWYTTAGVGTNNLVSVSHGDWATICVSGSGVLNQPSS